MIRKRFLGTVIIVFVLINLCTSMIFYHNSVALFLEEASLSIRSEEDALSGQIKEKLEEEGRFVSPEVADIFVQYIFKSVHFASETDSNAVLASESEVLVNDSGVFVLPGAGDESVKHFRIDKHNYLTCMKRIRYAQKTYFLGIVRDITDLVTRIRRSFLKSLLIGLVISLILTVFAGYYIQWLIRPLGVLMKATEEISAGNYEKRVDVWKLGRRKYGNNDEFIHLADQFNRMADSVNEEMAAKTDTLNRQNLLIHAIAHELRTPVTAIAGFCDTLLYRKLTEEQTMDALFYMKEESRRLGGLSDKLTQLILLKDRENERITLSPLSLESLVRHLATLYKENEDIAIHIEEAGEGTYLAEEDLLMILITNLIGNARKAHAKAIEISLKDSVLSVSDDGDGISPEDMDRVMDPFFQSDSSRNSQGFGLGLSICKEIARLHGSELYIDSILGQGSRFSMYLQVHNNHMPT